MPEQNVFSHLLPQQASPSSVPSGSPTAPGVIYGAPRPVDPFKVAADNRATEDQTAERDKRRREKLEWEATHNPDGTLKPKPADPPKPDKADAPYSQSALDAFDRAISTAGRLKVHPGLTAGVGMPSINPLDGNLAGFIVPGSKAKDFRAELDSMKAQVFLPMVQSMKGMGALSNAEGEKLTAAIGALDPGQSEEQFKQSLDRIIGDLQTYRDRGDPAKRQGATGGVVPGAQGQGSPPQAGGPPPGYEAKFNDEIPPPTAYRMSDQNEKAYLAFIESQKGNPGFSLDMANKFLSSLGEQPVEDNGFVKATQEGNVRTSGVDTRGADAEYQAKVDALAKERDTIGGEVDAFGRGAADTVTLGLGDKASAALATLNGGTYADNLARERLTNAADEQANPWARLGGQALGAAILPMGEGRGIASLMAKGGGYGAGYSALSSDEPFLNRADNALAGAVTGAAGGAAGAVVEKGGRAVSPYIAQGVNALRARNGAAAAEVGQNMNALLAGERWDIPMRQPDIRPSTRADFAAVEVSQGGNPIVTKALEGDKALVRSAVSHVGGKGTPQDPFSAGERVQNAGRQYIVKSRAQANALYGRAEKLAGPAKAAPEEAASTLAENIADLKSNGPKSNAGAIKYLEDLKSDIGSGPITIQKLRSLRTNMRGQISERNLTSTDTERRVMQVLDAAARDIEKGLSDNPRALAAYKSADAYFRQKQDFIKQVVQTFTGARNAPLSAEQSASRLMSMTKAGGDSGKFSRMWSELEPAEKSDLQATIAESFGVGRNGEFSLAALATNLRKVNPRTINEVFGKDGAAALRDLQEIARAKTGTANALNKSRTAVVAQRNNTFKDLMMGVVGGGAGGVPGAVAGMMARGSMESFSSKRMARLLLSPDFTKWLKSVPATTDPKAINRSFELLDKVVARAPSIRGDAQALQQFLAEAFTQSPGKLAASEDEGNGGPKPPQQ